MISRCVSVFRITAPARKLISVESRTWNINFTQTIHSAMSEPGPIETLIRNKITKELEPVHLEIINESPMHNVPKGSESHFKVIIVSSKFEKQMPIKRHRMVHDALKTEIEEDIHALTLVTKTPEQWEKSDKSIPKSPPCRGGSGL